MAPLRTTRSAAATLALTLGLVLVAASCGSDSDDAAPTTTTEATTEATTEPSDGPTDEPTDTSGPSEPEGNLSKAAFIEAADLICKEATDETNAESAALDAEEDISDETFEAFLVRAAESSIQQLADVRELGFPAGDEDALDDAFTTFEEAFDQVIADPAQAFDITSTDEWRGASTFMASYGFKQCGDSY